MTVFLTQALLAAPLFLLVLAGYGAMKLFRWSDKVPKALNTVVFNAALPLLLFHLMSGFSRLPPADFRVLAAFFGGCLVVFFLGRLTGTRFLGLDQVEASVLGIGGVFSNNVMLGLPLATMVLGVGSVPSVSLVLVFNALILWTLITVAVEWARHGSPTLAGLGKTLVHVTANPVILGIVLGLAWNATGWTFADPVEWGLGWISRGAGPLALLSLGMGLAGYRVGREWKVTGTLAFLKLVVHPLAVWALAAALGLPPTETRTVVLLASIAVGANVYLMSRQFGALEVPVGQGLLISTLLSAVTTPLFLAVVR